MKIRTLVFAASAALCCFAADEVRPDWENPAVNSRNRLPARTYSMPLKDEAAALTDLLEPETPWAVSLNGDWKISWAGHPSLREKDFWKADFDDTAWNVVDVPSCLETRGFGAPQYTNIDYPHKAETPTIRNVNTGEDDYNPVASYRRRFTVPENWRGRRVILRFDGVFSAYYVWVNGHKVGYAEDSCLPSEFDVTECLKADENILCVEVYRWSDGSFLENQDAFRFHGIFRDVTLWSMPKDGIWDFAVKTQPVEGYESWRLALELEDGGSASLYDADKKKVGDLAPLSNVRFGLRLKPRLWSAEDPYLYTLVIKRGSDIRMKRVGFKEQKLKGGRFLVNGRPVKVHGVNRCETSPDNGRTVTREEMLRDVEMFKRHNVDTVRTSHYPNHHVWYDLCDRYGVYVISEANVETHGFNYDPKTDPAFKPEWNDAFVERNVRHVRICRNHPSVTVWSLGNEAPAGIWATNALAAIRALDASRPTVSNHEGDKVTDIESGGYGRVESLEERGKKGGRTFFYIEYAHAMGNALGNFQEYWDAFDRYDCLMGGCVWDWADQAVWKYTDRVDPKTGRRERYLGYGGDWDETPNSGNFCVNGLVNPLREVSAKLLEVAYVHRPLVVTRAADGTLVLRNRWSFTPADICTGSWELLTDGVATQCGVFDVPRLAPGGTCDLPISVTPEPGKEYFLNISFATKAATRWAEKGWTVARNQVRLTDPRPFGRKESSSDGVRLDASDPQVVRVTAGPTRAVFSRTTGTLCELTMDGRTILRDPAPGLASGPRLTCLRALTDNDRWMTWGGRNLQASGLMQLRYHPSPLVVSGKTVRVTTAVDGSRSGGFRHAQTWMFGDDGTVMLRSVTEPHGTMPEQLPRFGLSLRLDAGLERMRYYGRGPHENYVDRCRSSFFGVWDSTVADQYVDYLRPQDCGYKTDVRWVEFTDETGKGVRFAASQPLCVQALHYSLEDLDRARHGSREGRYRTRLEPRAETFLNLDIRQCGLGGASCGPKPMDKYLFPAQREEWTLFLSPAGEENRE